MINSVRAANALVFLVVILAGSQAEPVRGSPSSTKETVGQVGTNRYYTPANQLLTPAGRQVELPGMRPQALALSPDGRLLVTAGKTHDLVVLDPKTGATLQRLPMPEGGNQPQESRSETILVPEKEGQLSFTGIVFSP